MTTPQDVVMKGICSSLCIAKYPGLLDSYMLKIEACFYVDHNYRHHCVLNSAKIFQTTRKHGLDKENWDRKDDLYYMKRYKLTTVQVIHMSFKRVEASRRYVCIVKGLDIQRVSIQAS
mgnify:CR=1 FL=1